MPTYYNDRSIEYWQTPLEKLFERLSTPPTDERRFFQDKDGISLHSFTLNGIRYRYKLTSVEPRLEERLNNPDTETIQIRNCFGADTKRGEEIRIKRIRDQNKIIIRYNKDQTKEFSTTTPNYLEQVERYVLSIMSSW
jgi:hypothetical protein